MRALRPRGNGSQITSEEMARLAEASTAHRTGQEQGDFLSLPAKQHGNEASGIIDYPALYVATQRLTVREAGPALRELNIRRQADPRENTGQMLGNINYRDAIRIANHFGGEIMSLRRYVDFLAMLHAAEKGSREAAAYGKLLERDDTVGLSDFGRYRHEWVNCRFSGDKKGEGEFGVMRATRGTRLRQVRSFSSLRYKGNKRSEYTLESYLAGADEAGFPTASTDDNGEILRFWVRWRPSYGLTLGGWPVVMADGSTGHGLRIEDRRCTKTTPLLGLRLAFTEEAFATYQEQKERLGV